HRALSPERVRVTTTDDRAPVVRVRDWMTGRRTQTSGSTLTLPPPGVTAAADRRAREPRVYLAPQSIRGGTNLPPIPLDVYGIGALAHLVLTGQGPAKDIAELQTRIAERRPLDAAAIRPDLPEALVSLVAEATSASELERPATVQDFLD